MPKKSNAHMPKLAIALVLTAVGGIAQAGEMILFEHPGFQGRQVELSDYTPSLRGIGFNERASSVVVRSGRWEVCTDDQFKGFCAILERGEYRMLDPRLNDLISSAREVGTTGRYAPPAGIPERRASVQLFSAPGFRGRSVQFDRDAPNFSDNGFNDRAASVIVNEGTWILCTDAGFQGTCRTYAPGRYSDLGYGMTRAISSAQVVRPRNDYQPRHRGGWDRPVENTAAPVTASSVAMYSGPNFTGRSLQLSSNVPNFDRVNFNDEGQSMVIQSGTWEFCTDAYFGGRCRVLGPGQYASLDPVMSGAISSVRVANTAPISAPVTVVVPAPAPASLQPQVVQLPPPRPVAPIVVNDVELFTAPDFGGRRFTGSENMLNFDANDFNDRFASIIINRGTWDMCVDVNYGGGCTAFGPGRYPRIGGLTSQISSMRRVGY